MKLASHIDDPLKRVAVTIKRNMVVIKAAALRIYKELHHKVLITGVVIGLAFPPLGYASVGTNQFYQGQSKLEVTYFSDGDQEDPLLMEMISLSEWEGENYLHTFYPTEGEESEFTIHVFSKLEGGNESQFTLQALLTLEEEGLVSPLYIIPTFEGDASGLTLHALFGLEEDESGVAFYEFSSGEFGEERQKVLVDTFNGLLSGLGEQEVSVGSGVGPWGGRSLFVNGQSPLFQQFKSPQIFAHRSETQAHARKENNTGNSGGNKGVAETERSSGGDLVVMPGTGGGQLEKLIPRKQVVEYGMKAITRVGFGAGAIGVSFVVSMLPLLGGLGGQVLQFGGIALLAMGGVNATQFYRHYRKRQPDKPRKN